MIRPIKPEELPQLVPLAQAFYLEFKLPGEIVGDIFVRNWTDYLAAGLAIILVVEDEGRITGTIGLILYRDPNCDWLRFAEAFWYVLPEHRGRPSSLKLLTEAEAAAKRAGVKLAAMIRLNGPNRRQLHELYCRLGYTEQETSYVKEL